MGFVANVLALACVCSTLDYCYDFPIKSWYVSTFLYCFCYCSFLIYCGLAENEWESTMGNAQSL